MEEINKRRESYALYKASLYERQQMSCTTVWRKQKLQKHSVSLMLALLRGVLTQQKSVQSLQSN